MNTKKLIPDFLVDDLQFVFTVYYGTKQFESVLEEVFTPWREKINNEIKKQKIYCIEVDAQGNETKTDVLLTADDIFAELIEQFKEKHQSEPAKSKYPFRVRVMDGTGQNVIGLGYCTGEVTTYAYVMPDGSLASNSFAEEKMEFPPAGSRLEVLENNPRIELDNGKVVYGCQVWWSQVEEKEVFSLN